jgi:transcriptional regulator with XRE-family HTH domain
MTAPTYSDVLAQNIRAARSRKRLGQANVVARMRALGFDQWHRQTMGKVERGERRLLAEEMLGLAIVLETSLGGLLDPSPDDRFVALPTGHAINAMTILRSIRHLNDGMVYWKDDEPRFDPGQPDLSHIDTDDIEPRPDITDLTPEQWRTRNQRIDPPYRGDPLPPPRKQPKDGRS